MTREEARALYDAGRIRGIAGELGVALKALDIGALESYLEHPAKDFAYVDTCKFALRLARELQLTPGGGELAGLLGLNGREG